MTENYFYLFDIDEIMFGKDDPSQNKTKNIVYYISGCSMLSTGILLAFVRTYEPFFILIIKKFISAYLEF